MRKIFTTVLLFACLTLYAQEECGSIAGPFNIEDSVEVAMKAPFKFDAAESLIYLKSKGYKLKEAYLKKLEKETPEIYKRFKEKEKKEQKEKEKKGSSTQRVLADAIGLDYVEVRFWRHIDYYTNTPLVSTFQQDIADAIDIINDAYALNDIPLRFYASCGNYTFKTNQYNTSTGEISKSDAESLINGTSNFSKGLMFFILPEALKVMGRI